MVTGNESGTIQSKLKSLIATHGWTNKNNKYIHNDGYLIKFPIKKNIPHGLISPSSLLSFQKCKKQLYLNRVSEHPQLYYTNLIGKQTKLNIQYSSISAIKGKIIHNSLSALVDGVIPKISKLAGLGWRTMLASVIHYSTTNIFQNVSSDKLYDVQLDLFEIEKEITKIVDKIWLNSFLNLKFNPREWRTQLSRLHLRAEVNLSRDELIGICDLIVKYRGENIIIDYKTSKFIPEIDKNNFSDQETNKILDLSNHELHNYVLQLSCYCWVLSKEQKCTQAWLIYTSEKQPRIIKFNIGKKSQEFVSDIIKKALKELQVSLQDHVTPQGKFRPNYCGICSFKMNCIDFFRGSNNISYNKWLQEKRKKLPVILNVKDIIPQSCTLLLQKKHEILEVYIMGSRKNYLSFAKEVMDRGNKLKAYVELSGSIHRLISFELRFARCD